MATNVVIINETRNRLCNAGHKDQIYVDIINELIRIKDASKQSSVGFAEPTEQESI